MKLWFAGKHKPTLGRLAFRRMENPSWRFAHCGRNPSSSAHFFEWSKGTKSVAIAFLAYKIHDPSRGGFLLQGERSTGKKRSSCNPANTLGQSFPKQVNWHEQIMGLDLDTGKPLIHCILLLTHSASQNEELPYGLSVNKDLILPEDIEVYWDDHLPPNDGPATKITEKAKLFELLEKICKAWVKQAKAPMSKYMEDFLNNALLNPTEPPAFPQTPTPQGNHETAKNNDPQVELLASPENLIDYLVSNSAKFNPEIIDKGLRFTNFNHIDRYQIRAAAAALENQALLQGIASNFHPAHLCNRLAAHLSRGCDDQESALRNEIFTLNMLRPIGEEYPIRLTLAAIEKIFNETKIIKRYWPILFISTLAAVISDNGQTTEALPLIEMAMKEFKDLSPEEIPNPINPSKEMEEAFCLVRYGYLTPDYHKARESLEQALEASRAFNFGMGTGVAHFTIGRLQAEMGKPTLALDHLLKHERQIMQCSVWSQSGANAGIGFLLKQVKKLEEAYAYLKKAYCQMIKFCIRNPLDHINNPQEFGRPDIALGVEYSLVRQYGLIRQRSLYLEKNELNRLVDSARKHLQRPRGYNMRYCGSNINQKPHRKLQLVSLNPNSQAETGKA